MNDDDVPKGWIPTEWVGYLQERARRAENTVVEQWFTNRANAVKKKYKINDQRPWDYCLTHPGNR